MIHGAGPNQGFDSAFIDRNMLRQVNQRAKTDRCVALRLFFLQNSFARFDDCFRQTVAHIFDRGKAEANGFFFHRKIDRTLINIRPQNTNTVQAAVGNIMA